MEQLKADQAANANIKRKLDELSEQDIAKMLMSMDIMNWLTGKPDNSDDPLKDVPEFVTDMEKQNDEARLRLRRWITALLDRVVFDPSSRLVALHYKWAGGASLASHGDSNQPRWPSGKALPNCGPGGFRNGLRLARLDA